MILWESCVDCDEFFPILAEDADQGRIKCDDCLRCEEQMRRLLPYRSFAVGGILFLTGWIFSEFLHFSFPWAFMWIERAIY